MIDYEKIGLKCGIEIHQRLDTKKLFCACSSAQKEEATSEISRRLRPVAGELGDVDPAAAFEFLRNREFVYKISPGESCLVEMDCEPPHALNRDALDITLQICKLLRCDVAEEIHVMRKTVIDGSNTGGFQRTAVVGMNGFLDTSFGDITITSIALEEEAARIEQRSDGKVVYKLSGLGIPLIEIATSPDIHTPEQGKEVAEKIGMILRSTKVQRGIGSIRQDVNISIKDGARIEIKGFQELDKIPRLIENEAARQLTLLEIKDELKKRGLREIKEMPHDATEIFKNTKNNFLRKIIIENGRIYALRLPKFAGMLKKQCGDRTFGSELSMYAESYGLGIIHSDEDMEKYNLTWEFSELRRMTKAEKEDLVFITAGHPPAVEKAISNVLERAKHCLIGVPEETRVSDGVDSKYTRPLPGAERMYPETDIPPIRITNEYLTKITVPKTLIEKKEEIKKQLPEELANQIITSRYFPMYEELSQRFDPVLVASAFTTIIKDISRQGHDTNKLAAFDLENIFALIKEGRIPKDSLPSALIMRIEGQNFDNIEGKFGMLSESELKKIVSDVVQAHPGANEPALMGLVMKHVRGRAPGELVMRTLREMKK